MRQDHIVLYTEQTPTAVVINRLTTSRTDICAAYKMIMRAP